MNPTTLMIRWYRESTGGATRQPEPYTTEEVLHLLRPDHHAARVPDHHAAQTPDHQAAQTNAERPVQPPTDERPGMATGDPTRGAAVRAVASQPSAWLGRLSKQHRREIGALADRLPTLLFHHSVGGRPEDLLRQYGGWSAWRYERALELAAACIAGELNRSRLVA